MENLRNLTVYTNSAITHDNRSTKATDNSDWFCHSERTLFFACLLVIFVIGITGNILTFCVFHKKYPSSTSMYTLKLLAVADCVYLTLSMIGGIFTKFHADGTYSTYSRAVVVYIVTFAFSELSQFVCVWLLVVVSYYRYIAVAKPLEARNDQRNYPRLTLLGIVFVEVILAAIRIPLTVKCNERQPYYCYPDYHSLRIRYLDSAYICCFNFLFPLVPLLFLSHRLVLVLKRGKRATGERAVATKIESDGVTRMILATVVVFILTYGCHFLGALSYVITPIQDYFYYRKCCGELFDYIIALGTDINSSCNVFLYICFNKAFRGHIFQMLW